MILRVAQSVKGLASNPRVAGLNLAQVLLFICLVEFCKCIFWAKVKILKILKP